ncbi:MAG TPA: hypothetical protein VMT64_14215 [Candidatus Binataceae bacterium]|nr:hypothetical protein [Candidatus Binataceae bacterium]
MPTKKKSPARKPATTARKKPASPAAGGVSAMATAQLKKLQQTVDQLKTRVEKEANARLAASSLVAEAKKARGVLNAQVKSLREEGTRLAGELKTALGRSDKLEAARKQAIDKVAELRTELAHRSEELKRKSEELARLAKEAAGRARDIIMSEGERPSQAAAPQEAEGVAAEEPQPANELPTVETETVAPETIRREEHPDESSIETEVHPERK